MSLLRPRRLSERQQQLARISLFSQLERGQLRIVDHLLHERHYTAGEVIFDAGEEGQGIYLVLQGSVGIFRPGVSPQPMLRLATVNAGSFFGELSLLGDTPRVAQARAESDCRLGVISRSDFMGLLDTHAHIASRISLQLARHLGGLLRQNAVAGSVQ